MNWNRLQLIFIDKLLDKLIIHIVDRALLLCILRVRRRRRNSLPIECNDGQFLLEKNLRDNQKLLVAVVVVVVWVFIRYYFLRTIVTKLLFTIQEEEKKKEKEKEKEKRKRKKKKKKKIEENGRNSTFCRTSSCGCSK